MGIESWSTTAGSNNAASPNGAPEAMAASGVNDTIRQNMASTRAWYEDSQWANFGHTPTRIDGDTFTVATDLTAVYDVGRRVKMTGSSTAYGTIASSSYLSPNTTVNLTASVIPVTLTTVSVGILSGVNNALAESAATHSSLTVSGNATVGGTLGVTGVATLGGVAHTDFARLSVANTFSAAQLFSDGTAGAPGIAFSADTDSGIYRTSTNEIAITTGGVQRARFASDIINLAATAVQVNGVSIRDASILNAGTLADARVASSNVTQHMGDGYARNISSPAKAGTTKTLSTLAPSGGSDGDIWFRY